MAKALVKLQNGKEMEGDLLSFNANLPIFYLHIDKDRLKGENVAISLSSVKAIFFLKKASDSDSVVHTETIDQSLFAGTVGIRLHVEFNDGELIHGSTHKYNPNDKGFYLVPMNPAYPYERIYVNALAVKKVDSRRMMGKILVDQKKITENQLEHALQYQKKKMGKKIGTILKEHNFITQKQLDESLKKQAERSKLIGEILMEAGYITEEQLNFALQIQRENRNKRLGQILVELKYITPNDICIALASQFSLPWADLSSEHIPSEIARSLPEGIIRELRVIPVERKGNILIIASADPEEPGLIGQILQHTDLEVELAVGYEGYIEAAINRLFS